MRMQQDLDLGKVEKDRASTTTQADARQAFAEEAATIQLASADCSARSKFSTCDGIPGASAAFRPQTPRERRESSNALRKFYRDLELEMQAKDRAYLSRNQWEW